MDKKLIADTKLANDVLERNYYKDFRDGKKKIELFLTGACKANCDYCYLKKHQKHLYPVALQKEDVIIENLQKIFNWYIENEFHCVFDIFSAEWLTTSLADKVFDCIYDTFSKVPLENRPKMILAADNMQFIKDKELTEHIQYQLDRMESIGIHFPLSASIDGKYCDYGRTENDDEFYQRLNDFMLKNKMRFHPMISADNIKHWIDNYLWFQETFDPSLSKLMTLEVRNNEWTEDSINQLLVYCDFLSDYLFKNRFNEDKQQFLKYVLNIYDSAEERLNEPPYNIIALQNSSITNGQDYLTCSCHGTLPIRVGDLTVAPCHRLYYPELEIGKFNVEDGKITDFTPTNVELLIMVCHMKKSCMPHCENCKFNDVCIGFCAGASFEEYGNMLVPQLEVCKMYRAKLTFLIYKYYLMGLFDELDNVDLSDLRRMYLQDLINDVIGGGE